ncbi:MAG: hypothetical protein SNJ77_09490, partial [Cytophagales bacterium]
MKKKLAIYSVALDLCAFFVSWVLFSGMKGVYVFESLLDNEFGIYFEATFVSLIWLVFYSFVGFYHKIESKSRLLVSLNHFFASIIGVLFICVLLAPLSYRIDGYEKFMSLYFTYFGLHFGVTLLFKLLMMNYVKFLIRNHKIRFNTIIIGTGKNALDIWYEIKKLNKKIGWHVLGNLYTDESNKQLNSLTPLGHFNELENIIPAQDVDHVIVAVESSEHHYLRSVFEVLNNYDVEVSVIP